MSRVFKAKTAHTEENPQRCGLSNKEIAKDDLIMYLVCTGTDARPTYQIKVTREEKKTVTYRGKARTRYERDYGMDDGRKFRSVFGGWQANPDTGKREKVFAWQEMTGIVDGEEVWQPVKCWSHIVLADVAEKLGYEVRRKKNGKLAMTTAHDGDRAVGNEHTVDSQGENAMEVLARAVCTDEEQGLVAPGVETERDKAIRARQAAQAEGPVLVGDVVAELKAKIKFEEEAEETRVSEEIESEASEDERYMAEFLGVTVQEYRELQQS